MFNSVFALYFLHTVSSRASYSMAGSVCVSLRSNSWPSLAMLLMVNFGVVMNRFRLLWFLRSMNCSFMLLMSCSFLPAVMCPSSDLQKFLY